MHATVRGYVTGYFPTLLFLSTHKQIEQPLRSYDADRIRIDTRQAPGGGRVPPSAIEAEESLIGAMLLSPEAVSVAYETVQPEDFYRPLHGQIFSAIIALANAGEPVDYVTVQAKLQERGADGRRAGGAVVAADEHAVGGERPALRRAGSREGPAAPTHRGRRRDRRRGVRRRPTTSWDSSTKPSERSTRSATPVGSTRSRPCSDCCSARPTSSKSAVRRAASINGLETGYKSARPDPPGTPAERHDDRRRPSGHRQDGVRAGHPDARRRGREASGALLLARDEPPGVGRADPRVDRAHRLVEAAHRGPHRRRLEPRPRGVRVPAVGQGLHRRQPRRSP